MNFPIFFAGFLVFIIAFAIIRKKNENKEKNILENFWNNEEKANSVRRQSLDSLPYIIIPISKLPIIETDNNDILNLQSDIIDLSNRKIVNLTGYTNTDLKLKYGAPNLPQLMSFDENFTRLATTIYKWGEALSKIGKTDAAITVLEFGVTCGTDIIKNYTLLAQLYKFTDDPAKIPHLVDAASVINSSRKTAIIEALKNI